MGDGKVLSNKTEEKYTSIKKSDLEKYKSNIKQLDLGIAVLREQRNAYKNDVLERDKEIEALSKEIENLQSDATLFEIKASEKSLPIRNILFGFVLGFGFTFLVIFTLWFLSLYTKPIANVYREIFCNSSILS